MSTGPYLTRFSISDLEGFSGVKAHTIRVWERRYNLLSPDRTDTNIRTYGLEQLKALLNVAYLNNHGVKISHIAALSHKEREERVREMASKGSDPADRLNALKLATATYDVELFERTTEIHRTREGFRGVVEQLYMPLLMHIGLLWQSSSICPAQEHFVSNLIRQKLIAEIDRAKPNTSGNGTVNVLYLPENEIHELGLLYIFYLLRTAGEQVIYLGQSVPLSDLPHVAQQFKGPIRFISVLTTNPHPDEIPAYLQRVRATLSEERVSFTFAGPRLTDTQAKQVPNGITIHPRLVELIATMA